MTQTIEQLQAKIAELEEEIERLRADNIAFARNLKGKSATTGATYEHICTQLAAAQKEINSPPAIDAYEMYMADDEESNPVERLRFFLSLALKDQDWIDVEKFIDDVSNHIAKAEQRVAELEAENAKLHEQVDLQVPKMAFTQLKEQLAAEQLNNKRLRDELRKLIEFELLDSGANSSDELCYEYRQAVLAYNTPSDTSALDSFVAERVDKASK